MKTMTKKRFKELHKAKALLLVPEYIRESASITMTNIKNLVNLGLGTNIHTIETTGMNVNKHDTVYSSVYRGIEYIIVETKYNDYIQSVLYVVK